mgnify:CR=1 FL=1
MLDKAGSSLEKVVKVNIFISEEKDFQGLNKVYRRVLPEGFSSAANDYCESHWRLSR